MTSSLYRYTLRIHPDVVSTLYKMPREAVEETWKVLRGLEKEPKPEIAKPVEGEEAALEIFSGSYRIVYEILEEEKAIKIIRLHMVE